MTKATLLRLAQHFNSLGRSKEVLEIEGILDLHYNVDKENKPKNKGVVYIGPQ